MELSVSIEYYLMTAVFAVLLVANFLRAKDVQRMILYAVVLTPFVLRVLRLK